MTMEMIANVLVAVMNIIQIFQVVLKPSYTDGLVMYHHIAKALSKILLVHTLYTHQMVYQ